MKLARIKTIICPIFLALTILMMFLWFIAICRIWEASPDNTLDQAIIGIGGITPFIGMAFTIPVVVFGRWWMRIIALILLFWCYYLSNLLNS